MSEDSSKPPGLEGDGSTDSAREVWTPERKELLQWFRQEAPSLADAYGGAVKLMHSADFPGRVHFIAHAARDIGNRLPDIICSFERPRRLDYKKELEEISGMWPSTMPPDAYTDDTQVPQQQEEVPISRRVYLAMSKLIGRHRAVSPTIRESHMRLLQALSQTAEPQLQRLRARVDEFFNLCRWFERCAHFRSKVKPVPLEKEMAVKFGRFEWILSAFTRPFFHTKDELDDLLQDTNS